ncbi:MAG: hypothetical protein ACN6PM_04030 [Achromobacter mucicolens]|uniref:hypothetical protein n=1 Tax=Achromobacter mucicolens TaxID=1389922 RepID=UPI003D0F5FE3
MSIALTGCGTLKTTSPPDSLSGWQNLGTKVELAKGTIKSPLEPIEKREDTATTDPQYHALFEREGMCGPPSLQQKYDPSLIGTVIATIIVTVVTSAISYWRVRQQGTLDERADASKRSSEGRIVMSPDQFQSGMCFVFKRRALDPRSVANARGGKAQDEHRQDLVIVMRVDRRKAGHDETGLPDHFSLTPIFARAYNSIAQTKEGGDIDLAVGITLHQIASVQGVPTLTNLGVAATAIQAVPLSGSPKCTPPEEPAPCHSSNILPLPTDGGTIVLAIGVQEAGDLGFEVDLAKAQVEAIAAALGPLSETLLQGHFARERVRGER